MEPRAEWEPEHHKAFVDLCIEMPRNHHELKSLLEPFRQRTNAEFTSDQLKNHWDTMVKHWKVWLRLINFKDMKWDRNTKTFDASEKQWTNYLRVNPEAKRYRWKTPLFLEKLEKIFACVNLDGEGTSGSQVRKRTHEHRDQEENDTGDDCYKATPQNRWSSSSHSLFVDLCFQESLLKGKRPIRSNGLYPMEFWNILGETIKRESGVGYTYWQLRNHFEVTRQAWKHWCLTIGAPIMKWDANTCKFGATNEDWDNYLKGNPKAAKFRRKHIDHAEKLAIIFKGCIEPGNTKSRPYRRRVTAHHSKVHEPAPLSTVYTNEPVTVSDHRANDDEDNDDDDEPTPVIMLDSDSDLEAVKTVTPECLKSNTEPMVNIPVSATVNQYEYTIKECMECLDAMEEIEKGSDLYMSALDLFFMKEHREIFLLLKTSSLRMSWLLRRRFGA